MRNFVMTLVAFVAMSSLVACGIQGEDNDPDCTGPECQPYCGDGVCFNEHCSTCPADCGQCAPVCGDDVCNGDEHCSTCPADCGNCIDPVVCGDDVCNGDETCTTCPGDCGDCPSVCGDGTCDLDEDCESCASDCGTCPVDPVCGDEVCNGDETCSTCPGDCGTCPVEPTCGDETCNGFETCATCPGDCGACTTCGDGVCEWEDGESHRTCGIDCCTPGPMRTDGCVLYFNTTDYLSGPTEVQVVGDCFGVGDWNSGPIATDTDSDGWAELNWCAIFDGDITSCRFSYRDPATHLPGWAQYGEPHLDDMCESDLEHVFCEDEGGYESCKLREGFYPNGESAGDDAYTVPLGNQ
ncbi:MAG: hypothetical protein V1738_00770 [Patescibacteria group bacterium]